MSSQDTKISETKSAELSPDSSVNVVSEISFYTDEEIETLCQQFSKISLINIPKLDFSKKITSDQSYKLIAAFKEHNYCRQIDDLYNGIFTLRTIEIPSEIKNMWQKSI